MERRNKKERGEAPRSPERIGSANPLRTCRAIGRIGRRIVRGRGGCVARSAGVNRSTGVSFTTGMHVDVSLTARSASRRRIFVARLEADVVDDVTHPIDAFGDFAGFLFLFIRVDKAAQLHDAFVGRDFDVIELVDFGIVQGAFDFGGDHFVIEHAARATIWSADAAGHSQDGESGGNTRDWFQDFWYRLHSSIPVSRSVSAHEVTQQ